MFSPTAPQLTASLFSRLNCVMGVSIGVFFLTVYLLTHAYDRPAFFFTISYSNISIASLGLFTCCFILFRALYVMLIARPDRLTLTILRDVEAFLSIDRLILALPILLMLPPFFAAFTAAKNLIPTINPFAWDMTLSEWDKTLHFGRHPWEWLHPLLEGLGATLFVSFCYKLWFIYKVAVIYWQAFSLHNPEWREEFFICLVAIWIVNGLILATCLSSVGPVYYGLLQPGLVNPYSELLEYLHAIEIYDLTAQDLLWKAYSSNAAVPLSGISAAPSMHVSVACLYALLGWRYGGALRWGTFSFLLIIMVGSIHLGWHYAIDGYIALISTVLIWTVTRLVLDVTRAGQRPPPGLDSRLSPAM